jgi:ABC-2 type transport system ATP-binding protein
MRPPLEFIAATKRWRGKTALNSLDLAVAPGEILALLGRAGTGKSSAVALATGIARPDEGFVHVLGEAPGGLAVKRRMGVMLQHAELPRTTRVHELIGLVRSAYPAPFGTEQVAAAAGVLPLLTRRIGQLSGAQIRAVHFALAICGHPSVLVLDDPAAGLDPMTREQVWLTLRGLAANGAAILLTSHYAEELESVADRVCVLSNGTKVAETSIEDLRAHHVLRRVVCRTATAVTTLRNLPEVLAAQPEQDGRVSMETGTPELLVQRLFALDAHVSDLQVLHAGTPHRIRVP